MLASKFMAHFKDKFCGYQSYYIHLIEKGNSFSKKLLIPQFFVLKRDISGKIQNFRPKILRFGQK